MSSIYSSLRADIIAAMKARDSVKATALRTADAAIQRAAMDTNAEIDDALTVATLRKAVKNLTDANVDFAKAGRVDLVTANEAEIGVLSVYLPQQITGEKLEAMVVATIAAVGATSRKEMGKVMGQLKGRPDASLIDFGAASKMIAARLA